MTSPFEIYDRGKKKEKKKISFSSDDHISPRGGNGTTTTTAHINCSRYFHEGREDV